MQIDTTGADRYYGYNPTDNKCGNFIDWAIYIQSQYGIKRISGTSINHIATTIVNVYDRNGNLDFSYETDMENTFWAAVDYVTSLGSCSASTNPVAYTAPTGSWDSIIQPVGLPSSLSLQNVPNFGYAAKNFAIISLLIRHYAHFPYFDNLQWSSYTIPAGHYSPSQPYI